MATASVSKPRGAKRRHVAASAGISSTQGAQSVAQKLTSTTCPRSDASSLLWPSSSVYETDGACSTRLQAVSIGQASAASASA